jgi:hypothetical protein
MSEKMTPEEVAVMIRARKIAKENGLSPDADVSEICKAAGVARKTGYQWTEKYVGCGVEKQQALEKELERIKSDYAALEKDFEQVSFENRGRKLAWEIHRVDE